MTDLIITPADETTEEPPPAETRRETSRWPAVLGGLALAVAVALRFLTRSEMWLDEALSVNIARLPRRDIADALRRDGSPPLYYLLLHYWMRIFGESNFGVRSLSGVFAVLTLPVMWLSGLRIGGRRMARATLLISAAMPFAIRYATEARMYSLLILLAAVGFLALHEALNRPRPLPFVVVAVTSGLLALSHYWSFYLLAATVFCLAARCWFRRGHGLHPSGTAILAIAAGGVLFVPWLPSFVYQLRHTGTPWAKPAEFNAIFNTLGDYTGGDTAIGRILLVVALGLAGLGLLGRPIDGLHIELDLRTHPRGRGVAAVTVLTLAFGLAVGLVFNGAFAPRYASVALVPFLLLVSMGTATLTDTRVWRTAVGTVVVLGLIASTAEVFDHRTQAGMIADAINARAKPGDLVAYCPDQLGPAVSRLITAPVDQVTFPAATGPQFVDWVDYEDRQKASNPTAFAEMLDARAGDGRDIWVVWNHGYRTFENYCEIIDRDLGDIRPGVKEVVRRRLTGYWEPAWLFHYPGSCRRPLRLREFPANCPEATIRPPQ